MSNDDVEIIHIDLDDESNSADEFVEQSARNKRQRESRKRFVKRKRQDLIESDDESTEKRVHRKNKSSSDSDFEPKSKRIGKKPKGNLHSDEDSSKKHVRKKSKGSIDSNNESKKENLATKSESLDSDDERTQSSSVDASKVVVPRTRKKVTPMRERASVDKVDDVDGSGNIPTKNVECLDSDTEIWRSFSVEVSEVSEPKKRKKVTPMRERTLAKEDEVSSDKASPVRDIHGESTSCIDSDGEKPESSPIEMSKKVSVKERLPKNESNADEADDGTDIPDKSGSCQNSNENVSVLVAEKPSCSSEEVPTNARPVPCKVEALSRDSVCENEENTADETDEDFMRVPEKCGFELGYKAEKIIGTTNRGPDGIKFLVQFQGREDAELVLNDKCKKYCPRLLIRFYEKHIKWRTPE